MKTLVAYSAIRTSLKSRAAATDATVTNQAAKATLTFNHKPKEAEKRKEI
ncbi:MAG: hypothetical protein ACK46L_11160 [Synechococcaceae cyanobacterium]